MAAAQAIWRFVQRRVAQANTRDRRVVAEPGRLSIARRRRLTASRARTSDGAAWAKRCVQHFFACADWLRARDYIPADAGHRPADWQREFAIDWRRLTGRDLDVAAEEEGVRHTPDEAQRLLAALDHPDVDPRIRLLILAGGDALRGGQVVRCMRSDLDLASVGEFGLGRLRIRGRGKKRGSVIDVDPVLRAQLDYEMRAGYLRECEAAYRRGEIDHYALFAQGRLVKGAVPVRPDGRYLKWASDRGLLEWFHTLEEIAGVEHVPGRGWYGLRRLWTDLAATHLESQRAMEILASHARGSRIAETVYRSKEDEVAVREASRGCAAIREALASGKVSVETALRSAVARAMSTAEPETLRRVLALLGEADPTRPETVRASVAGAERPPELSQKLSDAPQTAGEASLSRVRKSLSRGSL